MIFFKMKILTDGIIHKIKCRRCLSKSYRGLSHRMATDNRVGQVVIVYCSCSCTGSLLDYTMKGKPDIHSYTTIPYYKFTLTPPASISAPRREYKGIPYKTAHTYISKF